MPNSTQDAPESIERRHAQLQHNVIRLQKALSHWTTLEAEYQRLKAELESAGDPPVSRIRGITQALHGTLVNEQEIEELLGKDLQTKRNAGAVVHLLSRRIDYVQQNSSSIEKQLDIAEKQLSGLDILLEPGMENEDGLPMMDIEEELDEEGNEVSSSITQAGQGAVEMIEALRQVGMQKITSRKEEKVKVNKEEKADVVVGIVDSALSESTPDPLPRDEFKSADFSSDSGAIELDGDGNAAASYPIIPQDESPEDAELRRQMLQYSLTEVGQVVAELDLDYPTVSYSDGEDGVNDDDDDDDDDEDDNSTEDEYGRSTKPVVTEKYRRQMRELEQRLGGRAVENIRPQLDPHIIAKHIDDIHTMRVQRDDQFESSLGASPAKTLSARSEPGPKRKGVRFADDAAVPEATKVSRFKSDRGGSKQLSSVVSTTSVAALQTPSGPPGRPLAGTITEHTPSFSKPLAPDEFDSLTVKHELDAEYHRARNKFIQQQGGFKIMGEDEHMPMVEERDGQTKKVSRFKAARLRADGM